MVKTLCGRGYFLEQHKMTHFLMNWTPHTVIWVLFLGQGCCILFCGKTLCPHGGTLCLDPRPHPMLLRSKNLVHVMFLLQLFSSLEDYDVLVNEVPLWEKRLSTLLGGMKIKFDKESPSVSVTEYLNHLYRVVSSLKRGLIGADATSAIQPGEFEEFTTRVLRCVLGNASCKLGEK